MSFNIAQTEWWAGHCCPHAELLTLKHQGLGVCFLNLWFLLFCLAPFPLGLFPTVLQSGLPVTPCVPCRACLWPDAVGVPQQHTSGMRSGCQEARVL